MGLIGLVAEVVVICCVAGGIASNSYVISSCDMLDLKFGGTIGPWRADLPAFTNGCEGWDKTDETDDKMINMGRACSMIALIFGCIFAFFFFFNQCLFPLPCTQRMMDLSSTCGSISLALVWFMFRSDVCKNNGGCNWGSGATALLVAQVFYLGAGIFSRCMREPRYKRQVERREERQDERADEEEKQSKKRADEEDQID